MTDPALEKGRKLIRLSREGVGGEKVNARKLLASHLKVNDLTLYDLDASLPVSQDLAALESWRESAALLTKLGTDEQDEVLTALVDATDLTNAELTKLITATDLQKLAEVRAEGWAYQAKQPVSEYLQAAKSVTQADILEYSGSLAQRLQQAAAKAHFAKTHPERLIKTQNDLERYFVRGILQSVSGYVGTFSPEGVRAHLNVEQLARIRALLAQHLPQAQRIALDAAEQYGRTLK